MGMVENIMTLSYPIWQHGQRKDVIFPSITLQPPAGRVPDPISYQLQPSGEEIMHLTQVAMQSWPQNGCMEASPEIMKGA